MNKNRILLILSLAAFVVMADNWVVAPIIPAISRDMGVSVGSAALIISAYMLPFGLFQLVFGYLGDKYGRIRVITGTMVFFTIGTGLCAIAAGLTDLAIYRALTGMFAGAIMPVSFALIGDIFPLNERQAAIGTFFGVAFLGQGLSTVIGGSIAYFLIGVVYLQVMQCWLFLQLYYYLQQGETYLLIRIMTVSFLLH